MRCVLLLSALAVAAPAAHISSSVSTRTSSDGRGTTFSTHHSSDGGGLGLRSSFGSGAGPQSPFRLGFRNSFSVRPASSGSGGPASISQVQARLNRVAEGLNEAVRRMQR